MKELEQYGECSNFKINPVKSEILNISVPLEEALVYQEEFPFIWREKELKYLGVKITKVHGHALPIKLPALTE